MPSASAGIELNSCVPVRYAEPETSVITPPASSPTTRDSNSVPITLRCASVAPRVQLALRVEQRQPRRRRAPARRAVDLAVREDGHVALDEPACVAALRLPEHDAVDVAQLRLVRMDDLVLGLERALQLAAQLDERRDVGRLDREPDLVRRDERVEGAAVRDVHVPAPRPSRRPTRARCETAPRPGGRPPRSP